MRGLSAAAFLLLAAGSGAGAQEVLELKRGSLNVTVRAQGTVVTEDVFRLRSTIEGRVEAVPASSHTWAHPSTDLAYLANEELAAMMDANATTPDQVLEARWQRVYKPTPVQCPDTCFILKAFARPKKWVKPDAVLFEAARKLRLTGRVRAGDTHRVKDGQIISFWDKDDPAHKHQGRVTRFRLDITGGKLRPGGSFSVYLDEDHYLLPGTLWEGEIAAAAKKGVLRVPTRALIQYKGEVFLPVRVSTGITTYEETEITAGASERTHVLILDPSRMGSVRRHEPEPAPLDPRKLRSSGREGGGAGEEIEPDADYPSDLSRQED